MTPSYAYQQKLSKNLLQPDPGQQAVIPVLDQLAKQLEQKPTSPSRIVAWLKRPKTQKIRGLYIYGPVGRGKTMLMDLFFDNVAYQPKRRLHFNGFMQEVHKARAEKKTIAEIAKAFAAKAKLLCLDEMQIVDIADAMIVGRLYEALQEQGVILVTTANLPPGELYKDGLNRDLFLPFIAKLKASMTEVELLSPNDYRLGRLKTRNTYLCPLGSKTDQAMDEIWHDLTDAQFGTSIDLAVLDRSLHIPRAAHGCARLSFAALCENPLGVPDYLALANAFPTLFVENMPQLRADQRNEAKRFILLIDTLYDARTHLVISAAVPPEKLLPTGKHNVEFARTVSRLQEMQSASWWQQANPTA